MADMIDFCVGHILDLVSGIKTLTPTLSFGQRPKQDSGLHLMELFSDNWVQFAPITLIFQVEAISGLGGTGVEAIGVLFEEQELLKLVPGHPMLPMLRIASPLAAPLNSEAMAANFDVVLPSETSEWPTSILHSLIDLVTGDLVPKLSEVVDFQIPRGLFGISL